jgi:hypothetical protein
MKLVDVVTATRYKQGTVNAALVAFLSIRNNKNSKPTVDGDLWTVGEIVNPTTRIVSLTLRGVLCI